MTSKTIKEHIDRFFPDAKLFWKEKNMPITGIVRKDNKLVMSINKSPKIVSMGVLNLWIEFLKTHGEMEVVIEEKGSLKEITGFIGDHYGTKCNICTREDHQMSLFDLVPQRWLNELPVDEEDDPFAVYVPDGTEVIPVFR